MAQRSNDSSLEIIFGKRRAEQFWEITTDPTTLPKNSTWCVMTRIPNLKYHQVGNFYGLRNWVEYGLKQSKNELGSCRFPRHGLCSDPEVVGDCYECLLDGQFTRKCV
jgi:SRSO17 transposase